MPRKSSCRLWLIIWWRFRLKQRNLISNLRRLLIDQCTQKTGSKWGIRWFAFLTFMSRACWEGCFMTSGLSGARFAWISRQGCLLRVCLRLSFPCRVLGFSVWNTQVWLWTWAVPTQSMSSLRSTALRMGRKTLRPRTSHDPPGRKITDAIPYEPSAMTHSARSLWSHKRLRPKRHTHPAWSLYPKTKIARTSRKSWWKRLSEYYGNWVSFRLVWRWRHRPRSRQLDRRRKMSTMFMPHVGLLPGKGWVDRGLSGGRHTRQNYSSMQWNGNNWDCFLLFTTLR